MELLEIDPTKLPIWMLLVLLALFLIGIIIALATGREVSFLPPKIGPKLTNEKSKEGGLTNVTKEDYGIKILLPEAGTEVSGTVRVSGTFAKMPPVGMMWGIVFNDKVNEFWPKGILIFDPKTNTWHIDIYMNSTSTSDVARTIIVASVGDYAKALMDYHRKVCKSKVYVGIDYSNLIKNDTHREDQVRVKLQREV